METGSGEDIQKKQKDGNEYMKLFNNETAEFSGTANKVSYKIPGHNFYSLHTHPNWDSPLSPGDFTSFLSTSTEKVCGATSNKAIYIIRKKPGYRRLRFQVQADDFKKLFDTTKTRIMKAQGKKIPDMTKVYAEAGKEMAKRYGLEYKIIKRKP